MIQVRVAQQSAVSVRIAGAAPVRVDVTGTAVVSAPEYSGPYDITPLFTAQVLPTTTCRLIYRYGYGRGQNKEDK